MTNTADSGDTVSSTPPVGVEQLTLPNGKSVGLEPKTLNYELQRFLASSSPTPQIFTFDHLNFAANLAELPADTQDTAGALAQILTAYPNAKVQLNGYAYATGSDPHNV